MLITRACDLCGADFEATRATARYCTPAHRNKAYRQRRDAAAQAGSGSGSAGTPGGEQADGGSSVQAALLSELRASQADDTAMGQALLTVARRIDHSQAETGASLSSLVLRLGIELERERGRHAPTGRPSEDEVAKARERRDRRRGAR